MEATPGGTADVSRRAGPDPQAADFADNGTGVVAILAASNRESPLELSRGHIFPFANPGAGEEGPRTKIAQALCAAFRLVGASSPSRS